MTNIILKSLTQTTYDSVEGYRKAIDTADSPAIRDALKRRLNMRERTFATLNGELKSRFNEEIASVSTGGELHQIWMDVVDAFKSGDDAAIARVEEGENYLVTQFRQVLERKDMDASLYAVIENAFNEVRASEKFSDTLERQAA